MKKIFFVVFTLLLQTIYAYDSFNIDNKSDFNHADLSPYIYYIQDKNGSLSHEYILKATQLKLIPKQGQIKNRVGPFWSRLNISNNSKKVQNFILYNKIPGTDTIDVYLYKNRIMMKKYTLGDRVDQSKRGFLVRYSALKLSLKPDENITLISKVFNYDITNLSWVFTDIQHFVHKEYEKIVLYALIGGFLSLFSIISFAFFFIYKNYAYLILSIYTFATVMYLFSLQGVFYALDLGLNLSLLTYISWFYPSLTAILFLLFTNQFFSMKKRYKKFYYTLLGIMLMHIGVILLTAYSLVVDVSYSKYTFAIGVSLIINIFYLLVSGFYMKEIGSKFYLIGQIILMVTILLSTLSVYGFIGDLNLFRDLVNIGIMTDIFLLLIAQLQKEKHYINKLDKTKSTLLEYSRFSSIGLAINNITHQWKQPLSHLGFSIMLLESILKNKKEQTTAYLNEELPKMNFSLSLMKNTMDEFANYYSKDIKKKDFNPKNSVKNVVTIFNSKIVLKNAEITLEIDENLTINTFEHIFSNIIMILIDNSLDVFKENIKGNKIEIKIDKHYDKIIINYKDNAGGIKITPIEKVFDYCESTKQQSSNKGSGLAILKLFVEDKLYGKVDIKNIDNGVLFYIVF